MRFCLYCARSSRTTAQKRRGAWLDGTVLAARSSRRPMIALTHQPTPAMNGERMKLAASTGDNDGFTSSRVVASRVSPGGGCFNVRRHQCDAGDRAGKAPRTNYLYKLKASMY